MKKTQKNNTNKKNNAQGEGRIAYLTAHRGSDGLSGKAYMPASSEPH